MTIFRGWRLPVQLVIGHCLPADKKKRDEMVLKDSKEKESREQSHARRSDPFRSEQKHYAISRMFPIVRLF